MGLGARPGVDGGFAEGDFDQSHDPRGGHLQALGNGDQSLHPHARAALFETAQP